MTRLQDLLLGAVLAPCALAAAACDGGTGEKPAPSPTWLEQGIQEDLPATLSDVGLFASLPEQTPSESMLEYEPLWPLWTSGTEKQRLLHVPDGSSVDTAADHGWQFPTGTVLAKTFSVPGGGPIETRLLFRRAAGWEYAVYLWNASGADADLLEGNWLERKLALTDGNGDPFPYTVPARLDCRTCHETSEDATGTPVLGVSALQLPASLQDAPFFDAPPPAAEVEGRSPEETAALGYFVGNCVACHNGGHGDNTAFSLYPEHAVENTVGHPTESETGVGVRVVAGDPESSVLFITVARAREPGYSGPFKAMPPLGVDRADPAAEHVLGAWIAGLPASEEEQ